MSNLFSDLKVSGNVRESLRNRVDEEYRPIEKLGVILQDKGTALQWIRDTEALKVRVMETIFEGIRVSVNSCMTNLFSVEQLTLLGATTGLSPDQRVLAGTATMKLLNKAISNIHSSLPMDLKREVDDYLSHVN